MPTRFPILIVDASSYISTAYHLPKTKISNKNITNIVVYSFFRMLRKLTIKFNISHVVIVWDGCKESKASTGLLPQQKLIMETLDCIRMEQVLQDNISAYDTIFSITKSFNHQHHDVIIATNNKNFFSLVNDATSLFNPFTRTLYNKEYLEEKYKFPLDKFPFFLALAGSTTDHISGVYGIGKHRAMLYVQRFKNLDDLYENIKEITDIKAKAALIEGKANAYESFERAVPHRHENPTTVARSTFPEKNWQLAIPFFEKYNYQKLINDIKNPTATRDSLIEIMNQNHQPHFDLIIITTQEQLVSLASCIEKTKILSIKIQGSSLDPMASIPSSISIAIDKKSVYYIPLHDEEHHKNILLQEDFAATLNNVFSATDIEKIINKAQYTLVMLSQLSLPIKEPIFDIINAASFVLHNFEDEGLEKITNFYLQQAKLSYQNTSELETKDSSIIINQEDWYAIADVHQSFILKTTLEAQLNKEDFLKYFRTIEMPMTIILAHMQVSGICCNKNILEQLGVKIADDLIKITQEIHTYCPTPININSNQQVEKLLFETLKLPARKRIRKKRASTDSSVLKELSALHPIPGLILKYRELHKYQRPYIEGLLQCINPKTHKIHPNWDESAGKTGRISASHPNVQSVPIHDLGYGIYIRSAFHSEASDEFISANYNDLELHIIAHLSQDKMLKMALAHTPDIHAKTASKLFGTTENHITSKQRSIAKKINLSITYGITAYGLATDQNIPYHQAAFAMRSFFSQFPDVRTWLNKAIEKAKHDGYVTTIFGRKRYIPTLRSKNRVAYDAATRLALNTIIQGSAAEIVKNGMIQLTAKMHTYNINGRILLHIHDQIVLSVLKSDLEATKKIIHETLISGIVADFAFKVTILTGDNWQNVTIDE